MIPSRKVNELRRFLEGDFEKNLLDSAILNLQSYHSLTFNNFAYAMREILRIVFHRLSPEEEIKKCSWYEKIREKKDVITRRQRYKYAIHGGIGEYLLSDFKLDKTIDIACEKLLIQIDILNSFTHVGETTYNLSIDLTKEKATNCFDAVLNVARLVNRVRNKLFKKIIQSLDEGLFEHTIYEYVENIDLIAENASVNRIEANKFINMKIDSNYVNFIALGHVNCLLQYGNKAEVAKGDGWSCTMEFPFSAPVKLEIQRPIGKKMTFGKIEVNTDSFYK